jgi:hypothetical protein
MGLVQGNFEGYGPAPQNVLGYMSNIWDALKAEEERKRKIEADRLANKLMQAQTANTWNTIGVNNAQVANQRQTNQINAMNLDPVLRKAIGLPDVATSKQKFDTNFFDIARTGLNDVSLRNTAYGDYTPEQQTTRGFVDAAVASATQNMAGTASQGVKTKNEYNAPTFDALSTIGKLKDSIATVMSSDTISLPNKIEYIMSVQPALTRLNEIAKVQSTPIKLSGDLSSAEKYKKDIIDIQKGNLKVDQDKLRIEGFKAAILKEATASEKLRNDRMGRAALISANADQTKATTMAEETKLYKDDMAAMKIIKDRYNSALKMSLDFMGKPDPSLLEKNYDRIANMTGAFKRDSIVANDILKRRTGELSTGNSPVDTELLNQLKGLYQP